MAQLCTGLLLSCFCLFHFYEVDAQRAKVDSLLYALDQHSEIENDLRDTVLVRLHNELAWEYYRLSRYDTAAYHIDRALSLLQPLSAQHPQVQKLRGSALNNQGSLLTERAAYDSALQAFRQAVEIWEQLRDTLGMANAYNNMGIIYDYRGEFDKSIARYKLALELRKAVNNTVGIADAYNNLGVVYHYQGLYQQALENYLSALARYRQAGDLDGVAFIYNNIGLVYQRQEQYTDALASYEDALEIRLDMGASQRDIGSTYANIAGAYMNQAEYKKALRYDSLALDIFEQIGDQYRIASILNNMGIIFGKLGELDEAIGYAKRALVLKEEISARKNMISTLNQLCDLLIQKGSLSEARAYCEEAVTLAREVESKDYLLTAYKNAARYYEAIGKPQQALAHLWEYSALKDTLNREEYSSKMADMSAQYESEKKAHEIELQKAQLTEKETYIRYQQTLIWGISAGLLIFMGMAMLSYRMYRSRHRAWKVASDQRAESEHKNKLLEEARCEIEHRNEELISLNEALSEEKAKVEESNYLLEEKVAQRTESLKQQNERLRDYAFFNAHKLRGPVANILGLIYLAQSDDFTMEEKMAFVSKLAQAARQLDDSIRRIQERLHYEEEDKPEET
jgi:tetratricopeptide (TPR) repeat protein